LSPDGVWAKVMTAILKSAAAYFSIVFAAGFLLGTFRVLLIEPVLGDVRATLAEMPLMLIVSWLAAGWVIRTFDIGDAPGPRLLMGGLAFLFLIGAEFAVGVFGFRRAFDEQFAAMLEGAGLIGLLGQIGFALIPAARLLPAIARRG
jgi:hypothetical protein